MVSKVSAVQWNPHPCLLKEELKGGRDNPNKSAEIGRLHKLSTMRCGSDFLPNFTGHTTHTRLNTLAPSLVLRLLILSSSETPLFRLDPCIASAESSVQYMGQGGGIRGGGGEGCLF